ncbi:reverse transcriptase [Legionella birminghamensis]|uniref:Reverse transcriptase n=1 Tax=Legionella birminghamensis TaxID=28083 RepID=A0A378JUI4_9GAMM|nr:group II intron reverse transcriptase/maturase [Legionella birminghamensis]KTC69020.1 reverse transcriptase [Legionella birminghamensis]STX60988.1 reverse transcriptase [Legionella birminghamensis]
MTARIKHSTGASSTSELDWNAIPWHQAQKFVHRLQVRIAKAYKEGKHGKVKSLQWLLTHSFYAKALAVKRVTQNKGGKTAGIDKIVWSTPKQKMRAIKSLKRRGYKPLPLRRIMIPKKQKGTFRPLSIPVMKCRAQQALYVLALIPISEAIADKSSFGFRPLRSTADAIERCFKILSHRHSAKFILEGDIKSCFDSISHQWLINNVPMDKDILKKWLTAGYMAEGTLFPTLEGTPQGGIISPILLNITLSGLEKAITDGKDDRLNKVHTAIYADDFIVSGASKELLEEKIKPRIEAFLVERGLTLSPEKTKITHIDNGFDFLGANIRKFNNKLIIVPAKDSIKSFLKDIRTTIKSNPTLSAEKLIYLLNPKIRGWTNYHRTICAKETFSKVSHLIFFAIWKWARRRHPNKGTGWILKKYFRSDSKRNWIFSTTVKDKDGKTTYLDIVEPTRILIRRHIKIRAEAYPFDPKFKEYFEKRKQLKNKRIAAEPLNKMV